MKKKKGKIFLVLMLIILSVVLHLIHYLIFRDLHHLMIYLMGDIAFVPVEVLMVSLVFDKLLEMQDYNEKKKKTYMLIELFYMELGNDLLNWFSNADKEVQECISKVEPDMSWHDEEFKRLRGTISSLKCSVDLKEIPVNKIYDKMNNNKKMLIDMISNPVLTEHDVFSDAVISTFHLFDELSARDLEDLSEDDCMHLTVDIERVYRWLTAEWVMYMDHLRKEYPFLYSRALETNPFVSK